MKKDPEAALTAAQSARRVKPSAQSATLVWQAQDALALADAEKKGAEAKRKLEEEQKKRDAAALQAKRNREAYLEALKKGDDAVTAKKYTDAVGQYQAALKLFRTDLVLSKLKSAGDLLAREKAASDAKQAEIKRAAQVKDLIVQGQKALAANKYTQAVDLFKQARKLAPDNVEALTGLTRAERERDAEAARMRAREDAKNRDAAFAGWMKQGDKALAAKRYADAGKAYDEALKLKPGDATAIKGKRAVEEAQKKVAASDPKMKQKLANYQLAMDAAKDAIKKNNWVGAVNSFKAALVEMPGDKAATEGLASAEKMVKADEAKKQDVAYKDWMKKGDTALAAKKYPDAIKAYDEALKIKPGDDPAIKGKRAAEEAQKKAVASDPKMKQKLADYQLAMDAARDAIKKNNWVGAVNSFKAALQVMPGDKAATEGLASAEKMVKAEEAKKRDAAYNSWMKQGDTALAAKKYADAAKAYDEALKIKPGDDAAIKGKRAAMEALKKPAPPPKNTKAEFDRFLQQGTTLEKQGKYADAVKAYQQALKWVAKSPAGDADAFKAYMGVGRSEQAAKHYPEAVKAYEEALKRKPGDADAKARLARAKANKP
jgi:tetratricopeptide (TPR) repeat protein